MEFLEVTTNIDENLGIRVKNNISYYLCNTIKVAFKFSKADFNFQLQFCIEGDTKLTTISSSYYDEGGSEDGPRIVVFRLKDLPTSQIKEGTNFQLQLYASTYKNGVTEQAVYLIDKWFRRPEKNTNATISNFNFVFREYENGDNINFYGSEPGIIVSENGWPNPIPKNNNCPDIKRIKIQLKDNLGTTYFTGIRDYVNGTWGGSKITKQVPDNKKGAATLSVFVVDLAGTEVLVGEKSYSAGRASISFQGINPTTQVPYPYNPHKNKKQTLQINHELPIAKGTEEKDIVYKYKIEDGGISPTSSNTTNTTKEVRFTYDALIAAKIFDESTVSGEGKKILTITATDAFGNKTTTLFEIKYDYYIPPSWKTGESFKIYHDFNNLELKEIVETSDVNLKTFFAKEGVAMTLPSSDNLNNTSQIIEIEMASAVYDGMNKLEFTNPAFTYRKIGELRDSFQFKYLVEERDFVKEAIDYQVYFRVQVKDSRGAVTGYKYSNYVFFSKLQMPTFTITSTTFESNNNKTLSVTFAKEDIQLKSNYERGGIYYTPQARLRIYVSLDPFFKDYLQEGEIVFTYSQNSSLLDQLVESNWTKTFDINDLWGENWQQKKIYTKVFLEIKYNYTSTIASEPYTYFSIIGGIPTVAHRKNHVGINTTGFSLDDVLRVAPVDGRTLITFEFLEGDSVTLDLTSKTSFISSLKNLLNS